MPRIIKNGALADDSRPGIDPGATEPAPGQVCTLEQWQRLTDKTGSAVQVEPGESIEPLLEHLEQVELVLVNFPVFTDGRGFSYGRELRERGYNGELRATGNFIRDQLTYLARCGFDAFQMQDEAGLEGALHSLNDFSEYYQASIDRPEPLFRRRETTGG